MKKTYSIRVPDGATAAATSGQMQACLRQFFIDGNPSRIAPDFGAGDVVIRRSLDERLVSKFSAALGASPGVALRRLAVTCMRALPAGGSVASAPPSRSAASNSEPVPWWAPLAVADQGKSSAKAGPASQKVPISPWRAFWGEAWPWALIAAAVVVAGLATGSLTVGASVADLEPYASWRPI
jgi:hypothetical protein